LKEVRGIRTGIATVALLLVAAGAAFGAEPDAKHPFRIGALQEKTGLFAPFSKFIGPGLRVAVDDINAAGGILGRKVELIERDDASSPARALLAAKELVGDQRVDVLYTGVISGIALAVTPFATERKILTFANGSSPQLGDAAKFPYAFQLSDISSKRVAPVAEALRKLGGHKVGIMTTTNPPNFALGEGLLADLPKQYGMEVVGRETFTEDIKDLTPQLQKMRDAGADIIAFDGIGREGIRLVMSGMLTLGWNAKVVTEPAVLSGDLLGLIPEQVRSQFYSVNSRAGTRLGGPPNPRMEEFVAKLKKIGPVENVAWSALAHDAVYLIKWAFETAQSQHGSTKVDALKQTLEAIGTADYPANYALMFGNPRYTASDHSTANADYSHYWALIHASPLVDGTYEGEELIVEQR
jgi:branched-chain amino acid transport system substrate-binding protein